MTDEEYKKLKELYIKALESHSRFICEAARLIRVMELAVDE